MRNQCFQMISSSQERPEALVDNSVDINGLGALLGVGNALFYARHNFHAGTGPRPNRVAIKIKTYIYQLFKMFLFAYKAIVPPKPLCCGSFVTSPPAGTGFCGEVPPRKPRKYGI